MSRVIEMIDAVPVDVLPARAASRHAPTDLAMATVNPRVLGAARAAQLGMRVEGDTVLVDGSIVGTLSRIGDWWYGTSTDGTKGPPRRTQAGAIGDVLPTHASAAAVQAKRDALSTAGLIIPRPDGRVEIGGRVLDVDGVRLVHAQLGQLLRLARAADAGPDALDHLAARLDREFRGALVVEGTGQGERPPRCAIYRVSESVIACRVSRFAIAHLHPRVRKGGATVWRGVVLRILPDAVLGAVMEPTRRHVCLPDTEIQRLAPLQLPVAVAGDPTWETKDSILGRVGTVPASRPPAPRPLLTLVEPGEQPLDADARQLLAAILALDPSLASIGTHARNAGFTRSKRAHLAAVRLVNRRFIHAEMLHGRIGTWQALRGVVVECDIERARAALADSQHGGPRG